MNATNPTARLRPTVRGLRLGGLVAATAMLFMAGCGPAPAPSGATGGPGDWLEFEGSLNASGTRHSLSLGGERRASLVDLKGTLLLTGPSRPGAGFRGEIIALADTASGLVGRAVWTDERGDQVFSELHGEGTATRNRITGTFIGGSGRYAGATGAYEFSWQYFLNTEDGVIQGRADALKGRVRLGQPKAPAPHVPQAASAPPPPGARP